MSGSLELPGEEKVAGGLKQKHDAKTLSRVDETEML